MAVHNLARVSGRSRTGPRLSTRETAVYARDLLQSLKSIAVRQRQRRFAELLDAAAAEADRLAGEDSALVLRKRCLITRVSLGLAGKLKFEQSR
jgi:hypothetical protein